MNEHSGFSQVMRFFLKDILIIRRFLVLALLAYALYAAIFFALTPFYFPATMLFALFFAVGVTIVDDYYSAHRLFCSLPIPRPVTVVGRYSSSILMMILGIGLCFGYAFLLNVFLDSEFAVYEPGTMASGILPFCVVSLLFLCLFYPLYFRFGVARAAVIFAFAVLGTAFLVFGIKALLTGLGFGTPWPSNPWLALIALFSSAMSALSSVGTAAVAVAVAVAALLISVNLSIRFYRAREF